MAFRYGFYNSLHGDQEYNAEDFSKIFDGLITDGVFDSIGEAMAVVPGEGFGVIVKTGKAWFNHTWNINSTYQLLRLSAADPVRPRYDAVVLEVDAREESRKNSLKIIKGTPAVNPVYPTLTNEGDLHQYPLAYVRVNAGATSVVESNIVPMVGQSPCPFVSGILKSVDITDLFVQWNGEFHDWFNAIQADLEGNVVTNLLHRIELVDAKANQCVEFQTEYPNTHLWAIGKSHLGLIKRQEIPAGVFWSSFGSNQVSSTTITAFDDVILNSDGTVTTVNPVTVTINKNGGAAQCNPLKGKWMCNPNTDRNIVNGITNLTFYGFTYIPSGATFSIDTNFQYGTSYGWAIKVTDTYAGNYGYEEDIDRYIATGSSEPPEVSSGFKAINKGLLGMQGVKIGMLPTKDAASLVIDNIGFEPKGVFVFESLNSGLIMAVKGCPTWEYAYNYGSHNNTEKFVVFKDDRVELQHPQDVGCVYCYIVFS